MRLVEVIVPAGKQRTVLDTLDDEGVDYVVTEEISGREYTSVVSFPLPTNAVEPVLGELREAGLDESAYTVVIDAETVISRRFEELQDRYEEESENEDRIAREELSTKARELAPSLSTYVVMTVVSAVIATAGLLLDSPAVVVGSMVIAPLIGPAMSTSVGTIFGDDEMFFRGLKLQAFGLLLSIVSSAAFALIVKETYLVPPGLDITQIAEIRERLAPDFLSLAVALGAGVAGVMSLTTGVSAALVGVMIAVALLPPAATVGIGLAWRLPMVSLGAGVLALVNGVSINLAALATLRYQGYRPDGWFARDQAENARTVTVHRLLTLVLVMGVLSLFLGGVTFASYQSASFEQDANRAVSDVLSDAPYQELTLLEFTVEYGEDVVFRSPDRVVVTVGRPAGGEYPELSETLDQRIERATGRDVTVEVRYVQVDRTSA